LQVSDILNLAGWSVLSIEEAETCYIIQVAPPMDARPCPACGSGERTRHGTDSQVIRDFPMHGKQVQLHIDRQRYRCKACRKTWFEDLPQVDERHSLTCRLVCYVKTQALVRTFVSIAADLCIDEKLVRTLFQEAVTDLARTVDFPTPRVLGLDELHLLGQPRGMVTDIEAHRIVEVLPDRKKQTVLRYLTHVPDMQQITCCVIDMHRPYLEALAEALPHASVVIDRFHVIKQLNTVVDQARKAFHATLSDRQRRQLKHDRFVLLKRYRDLSERELLILEVWLNQFPELEAIYTCKELFADIYEVQSKPEALERYVTFLERVEQCDIGDAFADFLGTIDHWHSQIFAYFDHRYTGGFVESANALARSVDRSGRGYSYTVLRARLLYGQHLLRQTKRRSPAPADVQGDVAARLLPLDATTSVASPLHS
jgi:transposase